MFFIAHTRVKVYDFKRTFREEELTMLLDPKVYHVGDVVALISTVSAAMSATTSPT